MTWRTPEKISADYHVAIGDVLRELSGIPVDPEFRRMGASGLEFSSKATGLCVRSLGCGRKCLFCGGDGAVDGAVCSSCGGLGLLPIDAPPRRTASLSTCERYRWRLGRWWDLHKPAVCFIGFNPSTADGELDDQTISVCRAYGLRWGYGSLIMVNLFAWRGREPKAVLEAREPVGRDNDEQIRLACSESTMVICAWGGILQQHELVQRRTRDVLTLIDRAGVVPHALKLTKEGHPRHPLMNARELVPREFAELRREGGFPWPV